MLLVAKEKELTDQRAENAALKSQLENTLADLEKQSGDLSGNKNDERLEKLLVDKEKELADQTEGNSAHLKDLQKKYADLQSENAALKSQLEKASCRSPLLSFRYNGGLSGNENELRTLREHVAAMVQSSHTDHVQLCSEFSAFI